MKNAMMCMALALTAATGLSAEEVFAAEMGKAQTIIRNGEQASSKGSEQFFTGNVRIDPLYPANNEMRSSGGSVIAPTGISILWGRF